MPDHITSIYPLSTIHLYSIAYSLVDFNLFIINSLFLSISTPLSRLDSYSAEPYHLSVFFAQSLTGDWTILVRAHQAVHPETTFEPWILTVEHPGIVWQRHHIFCRTFQTFLRSVRVPGPTKRCTQRPPLNPRSSTQEHPGLVTQVTIFSVLSITIFIFCLKM